MTPFRWAAGRIDAARGHLFVWSPVCLGTGIGLYFMIGREPSSVVYAALFAALLILSGAARWLDGSLRPVLIGLALLAAGVLLAGARANLVAAPVLDFRFYGAVEGRVVIVDRSQSDAVRLTLDRVRLDGVRPEKIPARVRVSLHGDQGFITPEPGLQVMMTAHLSAPEGPVEPGGFDFQRMAWFRQIGAVGYTRVPALAIAPATEGRAGLAVHRLRTRISAWVRAAMPGEAGAFAAAIMTGDRSEVAQDTLAALRGANLAHLLAISGLHMGLLTGFVFAALRYGLALVPALALRYPTKKIAAVLALAAGAFYLALSGGNVATQRAFIMVAVMFVAVLFDRRALTLRAVALAALIVLFLHPEALPEPGFQMSFAATTALVAVFGGLQHWPYRRAPRWARPVLSVIVASAVAGAATAPFSAAHFNQLSYYGLLANFLSVPVMGSLVMPAAVLAAVLAPLGLAHWALLLMRPPIEWILAVAHRVSQMDGALGHVVSPSAPVLPLIALGALLIILWPGRARVLGLAPMILGFVLWGQVERPELLISKSGGLVGLMTAQGRVLNKPRGEGFSAVSWLENDGDAVAQADAFARAGFDGDKQALVFSVAGQSVRHLSGRGAGKRVAEACGSADLVILAAAYDGAASDCMLLDRNSLSLTGPVAIFAGADGLKILETHIVSGQRLWNSADLRAGAAGAADQ